ncbi:MAG: putative Tic20 family protein, partial [Yoonia sp.]
MNEEQQTGMTSNRLTSDEKLWSVLSHLSLLLGVGILLPLIVYLVKKGDSPAVAEHAKEALNFHISVYLYAIA